jgi:hypothetical protein
MEISRRITSRRKMPGRVAGKSPAGDDEDRDMIRMMPEHVPDGTRDGFLQDPGSPKSIFSWGRKYPDSSGTPQCDRAHT